MYNFATNYPSLCEIHVVKFILEDHFGMDGKGGRG